jgi:hypothetical protein
VLVVFEAREQVQHPAAKRRLGRSLVGQPLVLAERGIALRPP